MKLYIYIYIYIYSNIYVRLKSQRETPKIRIRTEKYLSNPEKMDSLLKLGR
jgi:hypothetical protein